jgi:4-amino-4-deoxy-L-arabinose transferase-like glycosyltransferase
MNARKAGLLIFILALALRLAALAFLPADISVGDQPEYLDLARNLRFHGTFSFGTSLEPSTYRAPLYPLLIAALWWGQKPPVEAVHLCHALLGALVAPLVYAMALRHFGRRAAAIGGLFIAFAPLSIHCVLWVVSETLFVFLLTAGLWRWGERSGFQAGLLLGAATLTRPITLILICLTGLAGLILRFNRGVHLRLFLGAIVVIGPWTVRNAITQHAFIPVQTAGWGSVLYYGTVDIPYGSGNPWDVLLSDRAGEETRAIADTPAAIEHRYGQLALERIVADPLGWVWLRIRQAPRLFLDTGAYAMGIMPAIVTKLAFVGGNVVFLVLSLAGIYIARKEWRTTYHLLLTAITISGIHFLGQTAEPRYSLPLVPIMAVFSGIAVAHLWPSALSRNRRERWSVRSRRSS